MDLGRTAYLDVFGRPATHGEIGASERSIGVTRDFGIAVGTSITGRFSDPALFAVGCRMATELDQPGFLRMERQRKLLEPLAHRVEEATGVVPVLESGQHIIGISDDHPVAVGLVPSPALSLEIQYVV